MNDSGWQAQPPIRGMARLQIGSSHCQIMGEQVPIADFKLGGAEQIYFPHHHLLWADPEVEMEPKQMDRVWDRVYAGMPLVMVQTTGNGHVALSADSPGEVIAVPLSDRGAVVVAERRFLAATSNIDYDWQQSGLAFQTQKRDDWEVHFPLGRYFDVFRTKVGPGLLLLHAPGNTFVRELAADHTICVQPRALVYAEESVAMRLHFDIPKGAQELYMRPGVSHMQYYAWLRVQGPGRVVIQSVFDRPEPTGPPVHLATNGQTAKSW